SHSTFGFLVTGPGLSLLLDRYLTRLLPWAQPIAWGKEISVRSGYALVGGVGFYYARPGIVPVGEAVYHGAMVSLTAFLLEVLVGQITRWLGSSSRPAWRTSLWVRLGLGVLFAPLVPVIVTLHPLHTVPKRTPASLGLAFEDVRFETADGLELAGWVVPHDRARGVVIFCPGHGRNRGHVAGL